MASSVSFQSAAWKRRTHSVSTIYFQQKFLGGDYLFKIGQINLDADFEVSEYAELFLNNSFGDMPSRGAASNAPVYPLAAPGLSFHAKPWKEWALRTGVYTSDAGQDVVSNIGFDWTIGGAAGFSILMELEIKRNFFGLPGTYKLGGMYNTVKLQRLGSSDTVKGNVDIYVVVDQTLLLDDRKADPGNFTRNFESRDFGFLGDATLVHRKLDPNRYAWSRLDT